MGLKCILLIMYYGVINITIGIVEGKLIIVCVIDGKRKCGRISCRTIPHRTFESSLWNVENGDAWWMI